MNPTEPVALLFSPGITARTGVLRSDCTSLLSLLDGKCSERVQLPAKAVLSPTLGNTYHTYFAAR